VRIRLLIDVETDDIERLQRYVADEPAVRLTFMDQRARTQLDAEMFGRFVGAKEAFDAVAEVAVAKDRP
jgi:hypothetical protein